MNNKHEILNSKAKVLFQALNLQLIYTLQLLRQATSGSVVIPSVSFDFRVERGESSDLIDSFIISRKNWELFHNIILKLTGFNFFASSFKARQYNLYDDNYVRYLCSSEYSFRNFFKSPSFREYRKTDLYKAFLIETRDVKLKNGISYKQDSVSVASEVNRIFFYYSE